MTLRAKDVYEEFGGDATVYISAEEGVIINRGMSAPQISATDVYATTLVGNLNASYLTGTVNDARLSGNVARRDQANTFGQANTLSKLTTFKSEAARAAWVVTGTDYGNLTTDHTNGVGLYLTYTTTGNRQFAIGATDQSDCIRYIGLRIDGYDRTTGNRRPMYLGTESHPVVVGGSWVGPGQLFVDALDYTGGAAISARAPSNDGEAIRTHSKNAQPVFVVTGKGEIQITGAETSTAYAALDIRPNAGNANTVMLRDTTGNERVGVAANGSTFYVATDTFAHNSATETYGAYRYASASAPLSQISLDFSTWAWNGTNGYSVGSGLNLVARQKSAADGDAEWQMRVQGTTRLSVDNEGVVVNGKMKTNQTIADTYAGDVVAKLPIYTAGGTLIGYIPVWDK